MIITMRYKFVTWCAAVFFAVSAAAAASPLRSAQQFWDAWSRGDVAGAVSSWDADRVGRFRGVFEREAALSCVRVRSASLRLARSTPAT